MKWKEIKKQINEQLSDNAEVKRIWFDEWANPKERGIVCEETTEGFDITTYDDGDEHITEYLCDEDCTQPCMFAPKNSDGCLEWQKELRERT